MQLRIETQEEYDNFMLFMKEMTDFYNRKHTQSTWNDSQELRNSPGYTEFTIARAKAEVYVMKKTDALRRLWGSR